jgi:hypothetical protein
MSETATRTELTELAGQSGWEHREAERNDYFTRGLDTVRVTWAEPGAISGGAHFQDGFLMANSRDLASVRTWLKR